MRLFYFVAVMGLVAASQVCAAPEHPPLPRVGAALPVTTSSHPFSAAAHQKRPIDLGRYGYVEKEYLVSGDARVFDWPAEDGGRPQVLAHGPYVTRILVRRPKDRRRFNGTVIVEPFNPSEDVDLPIMWAQSYRQMMSDGYAWVGITIKPNTIKALKRFDPARYAAVSMTNPRSAPACGAAQINPLSGPATTADESGLAWDMLSQIGTLLKSGSPTNPIPWTVSRLYMTGQSQTAGYARTYASVFARTVAAPRGGPLYDGYIYAGSPPWQVPLNQCRADLKPGDPRLITPAVGVPVIEIFTQGDMGTNLATRRPDADTASDRFRRYEVPGAPHVDPWESLSFADDADMARARMRDNVAVQSKCEPQGVTPTDFPNRYVFDGAWRGLDQWVRRGVPPPHGAPLELKADITPFRPDGSFVTDRFGNAKGGVRTPYVDVPTAKWVGAKSGPFVCLFEGYKIPFSADELRSLYLTRATYVGEVRADAAKLVAERWLTRADAAAIAAEAALAKIPPAGS